VGLAAAGWQLAGQPEVTLSLHRPRHYLIESLAWWDRYWRIQSVGDLRGHNGVGNVMTRQTNQLRYQADECRSRFTGQRNIARTG